MSENVGGAGSSPEVASEVSEATSASQDNISTNEPQSATGAENLSEAQQNEIQEAIDNGDAKEAQRLIKKYQLKVRGKTIEKEIDLSDDDFIKNQLQLAEVSKQSMQEAAELKKAYQKELERFRQNPWQVLEELGLNPDDLAESRIQQRIEEMKKSPEQLEKERIQLELQQAREEAKRLKEEKEAFEFQKLQEQAAVQINDEITEALSQHGSLPNTSQMTKRIADTMLWAMNNGFEDVTAADVVPLVEQEWRQEMAQLFDQYPEEALEQLIGKKNIERMRKKRVAQVKAPTSVNDIKQTALAAKAAEASRPRQQEKIPAKEFFKKLGRS